ncbi:MAG: fatty acid desaturase [Pseudomonadota bacterium]
MSADSTWREVTSQIVHDPQYKKIAALPLISWDQIAIIVGAYTVFTLSAVGWLYGYLPWLVSALISGVAIYASFTPLHDATHRALSRNRSINSFLGTLSGQLIFLGVTTSVYRTLHLTHHRFAGDASRDPDEAFTSRRGPALWLTWIFADLHWSIWYFTTGRDLLPKKFFWEIVAFNVVYFAVVAGFLISPFWLEFIAIYLIPQRIGVGLVVYLFAYIQHPDEVTFEERPFQTTAYIPSNWLQRFFMLGQADHHIHHLLPNLPYYRYLPVWELGNSVLKRQAIPEGSWFGPPAVPEPAAPAPTTLSVVVTDARDVGKDIRAFTLEPEAGSRLPDYQAGAHITLHLPSGAIRHYSLCGDPAEATCYRIAVKRDDRGRGGSMEVHDALTVGSTITIGTPRNNFVLYEEGARFTLIAGGVGATPLLSMAHRLTTLGKPFTLHLCARDEPSLPFGTELTALPFHKAVRCHFDEASGVSSLRPDTAIGDYQEGDRLYVCGPEGFMGWIRQESAKRGWPDEAVLYESFSAPMVDSTANGPFTVELARTGKSFDVPADKAIIDMLPDLGVTVQTSCMQGVCGTCITPVVDGEIDHRDASLTESERASGTLMCVCVSRGKSGGKVVLDI